MRTISRENTELMIIYTFSAIFWAKHKHIFYFNKTLPLAFKFIDESRMSGRSFSSKRNKFFISSVLYSH